MKRRARFAAALLLGALVVSAPLVSGSSSIAVAATTPAPKTAAAATTTVPTKATTPTTRPAATTTTKPASTSTTTAATTTTTTTVPRHRSQTTTTTTPAATAPLAAPGISLVSQPPWIPTRGVELMELHLDDAALATTPGAEIELTIHHSVSSRSDFESAVSGAALGSTRSQITFPLASLPMNPARQFLVGFGLSGSDAPRRIGIASAGVYPVEVGVIDAGVARATFVTWMVVVDQTASALSQPLRLSWIWQVATGPLEVPNGTTDPTALGVMQPGGRLDHISTLLSRAGRFPLTLGIAPQTLAIWRKEARSHPALESGVDRVRRAAAGAAVQLLPEPYVPIDGPTIEAEGLGSHLPDEYVAGLNAIEQATGQVPDPRVAFVDPVDESTISRLTQILIGRFVVPDTALAPVAETLTPAQPFSLTTRSGIAAPAIATDSGLERLIESPGPAALRVQRVLAALAEIANEAPSEARGIVISTPKSWSPDVATVTLLLHDLAGDPLVKPATLDNLFSEVAPAQTDGGPVQRQLAPTATPAELPLQASDYDQAVHELTAYEAMVVHNDPSVAASRHALLLSLSTANPPGQAQAFLATISAKLTVLTSGITTTAKTLTLTARRANLPLSFNNSTGRAGIKVRVHLESPKLIFPRGPDVVLTLPLGHTTAGPHEFPVETRASGTFAMTITLESPDGTLQLSSTRVTIRSAVFSGIGIALTLGALLFLAGWWGNHFWRTRRSRRRARTA